MTIESSDKRVCVDIGGNATWQALIATVRKRADIHGVNHADDFFKTGCCKNKDCLSTAREINIIRDELSQYSPSKVVYCEADETIQVPWGDDISPVITSCANYFTTGDGHDLLAELVRVLTYSAYTSNDVEIN